MFTPPLLRQHAGVEEHRLPDRRQDVRGMETLAFANFSL